MQGGLEFFLFSLILCLFRLGFMWEITAMSGKCKKRSGLPGQWGGREGGETAAAPRDFFYFSRRNRLLNSGETAILLKSIGMRF